MGRQSRIGGVEMARGMRKGLQFPVVPGAKRVKAGKRKRPVMPLRTRRG